MIISLKIRECAGAYAFIFSTDGLVKRFLADDQVNRAPGITGSPDQVAERFELRLVALIALGAPKIPQYYW